MTTIYICQKSNNLAKQLKGSNVTDMFVLHNKIFSHYENSEKSFFVISEINKSMCLREISEYEFRQTKTVAEAIEEAESAKRNADLAYRKAENAYRKANSANKKAQIAISQFWPLMIGYETETSLASIQHESKGQEVEEVEQEVEDEDMSVEYQDRYIRFGHSRLEKQDIPPGMLDRPLDDMISLEDMQDEHADSCENGDSLSEPKVTKEELDKELDEMFLCSHHSVDDQLSLKRLLNLISLYCKENGPRSFGDLLHILNESDH